MDDPLLEFMGMEPSIVFTDREEWSKCVSAWLDDGSVLVGVYDYYGRQSVYLRGKDGARESLVLDIPYPDDDPDASSLGVAMTDGPARFTPVKFKGMSCLPEVFTDPDEWSERVSALIIEGAKPVGVSSKDGKETIHLFGQDGSVESIVLDCPDNLSKVEPMFKINSGQVMIVSRVEAPQEGIFAIEVHPEIADPGLDPVQLLVPVVGSGFRDSVETFLFTNFRMLPTWLWDSRNETGQFAHCRNVKASVKFLDLYTSKLFETS